MSVRDLIDRSIAAREEMNHLLQVGKLTGRREMHRRAPRGRASWTPMMDITETERGFQVLAELPGVDDEDVAVEISKNRLTISGVKGGASRHRDEKPFFRERSFGGFHRTILLPSEVDEADVRVSLERGVLTVILLKSVHERRLLHETAAVP